MQTRMTLGDSATGPEWAIAYKFTDETAETTLTNIIWQVSRQGRVIPVAILEPVELCGATITRASLHNYKMVEELELSYYCIVEIKRANEIIPQIIKKISNYEAILLRYHSEIPNKCPSCAGPLHTFDRDLFCINKSCPDQVAESIEHWCSRDGMNIDGIGEVTAEKLITSGAVINPANLYDLTPKALIQDVDLGSATAHHIVQEINKSKTRPFKNVLYALGIPHIGKQTAKRLAELYPTFDALYEVQIDELNAISDIGPITAQAIVRWRMVNAVLAYNLMRIGIGTKVDDVKSPISNKLEGQVICLSGKLSMQRRLFAQIIEDNGGTFTQSVTKNTTLLIAGEKAGSKVQKAQELGIPILTEKQIRERLGI